MCLQGGVDIKSEGSEDQVLLSGSEIWGASWKKWRFHQGFRSTGISCLSELGESE